MCRETDVNSAAATRLESCFASCCVLKCPYTTSRATLVCWVLCLRELPCRSSDVVRLCSLLLSLQPLRSRQVCSTSPLLPDALPPRRHTYSQALNTPNCIVSFFALSFLSTLSDQQQLHISPVRLGGNKTKETADKETYVVEIRETGPGTPGHCNVKPRCTEEGISCFLVVFIFYFFIFLFCKTN